tara:strand:+ start:90 stop:278 length:189 start_codon:yes stop_codon:yes gene_type:complete
MNSTEWKEITSLYAWKDFYSQTKQYDRVKGIAGDIIIKEKQIGISLYDYQKQRYANKTKAKV